MTMGASLPLARRRFDCVQLQQRHRPEHELKAITYHQLRVAQTATGWEASVIFDI